MKVKGRIVAALFIAVALLFGLSSTLKPSSERRRQFSVEPEVLKELEIQPCFTDESEKRTLYPEDSLGSLFAIDEGQICIAGRTDKTYADYAKIQTDDVVHSTVSVRFNWTKVGECPECKTAFCTIKYYGYRQVYRLSPDFGYYKSCNSDLPKYHREVAESTSQALGKNPFFSFPFRFDCPIEQLPLKFDSFSMCRLKLNSWYMLEYSSLNELEFVNKSTHRLHHRTHWIFSTNYSKREDVFIVKARPVSCSLKILTLLTTHLSTRDKTNDPWIKQNGLPFHVTVEMKFSYKPINNDTKDQKTNYATKRLLLTVDNSWQEFVYNFSTNSSFELCYRGMALVEIGSENVTAFIANKTQWVCLANRILCSPPAASVSTPNVNCRNWKSVLALFFVFVFICNDLFMSCS